MIARVGILLAALVLAACASSVAVDPKGRLSGNGFGMQMPAGWILIPRPIGDGALLTRDGVQFIAVTRVPAGSELPATKKNFASGVTTQEAAGIEVDELRAGLQAAGFELIESSPADLAGRPAFRLVYLWTSSDGLRLKRVHYVTVAGGHVYRLTYVAPSRYYYERDLGGFENARQSLVLVPPS